MDCTQLQGRMRSICEGTSGLSEEVRQQYIALWEGKPPPKPPSTDCVYRGVFLEQYVDCPTCVPGKTLNMRVYGCQLHGTCVIGKDVGKVKGCLEPCLSRLEPEAEVK